MQLNLHLSGTGHAEEQQIRPILTCRSGLRRELLRGTIPPDEGVRIQQHLHGVPVQNSSGSGSSKSSLVQMAPGARLGDVVKALNSLGATPQDLLAILQALKSAGALTAELEVI